MPEPPRAAESPASDVPPSRFRRWRSRRVVVRDESMRPTLEPGDRLLVDLRAYRDRLPRAGEIVVLVDPEAPERWLVKRVASVDSGAGTIDVRGDATEHARDSRRFGPVPLRSVIGPAYRLYFPPGRRREL
ncbi:MAG: S26 family signal peptidase [Thermoplasmata archaeon]